METIFVLLMTSLFLTLVSCDQTGDGSQLINPAQSSAVSEPPSVSSSAVSKSPSVTSSAVSKPPSVTSTTVSESPSVSSSAVSKPLSVTSSAVSEPPSVTSSAVSEPPSATPKPCCHPKVWQGVMYQYIAAQDYEWVNHVYFDGVKKTHAMLQVGTPGNGGKDLGSTSLWYEDSTGTKINYIDYNWETQRCTVRQFTETYEQMMSGQDNCIPETAKYRGSFTVGNPDDGSNETVHAWRWIPDPDLWPGVWFERQVTATNCLPVSEINQGTLPNTHTTLHAHNYRNIQTSISDPSVFTVPANCTIPT